MITKYDEFIVEKMLLSINESIIEYSDRFISLLQKIDSPIAGELLSAHKIDRSLITNYFDLDTKDTISYVSDKKAQQFADQPSEYFTLNIPSEIFRGDDLVQLGIGTILRSHPNLKDALGNDDNADEVIATKFNYTPAIGEVGKLLTEFIAPSYLINRNCLVLKFGDNFVLTPKYNTKPVDTGWIKNRQSIRVGRGIKALTKTLGFDFSDAQIEDFVNKWKSSFEWANNAFRSFEEVSGDEIAKWYNHETYERGLRKGTLSSSCMANKSPSFFSIYTANPEVVSLLILRSEKVNGTIVGRALVWKLDSGKTFMDRVYSHDDDKVYLFNQYAVSKGWYYKLKNDSDAYCKVMKPDGTSNYMDLGVKIKPINYALYPYLDTLKYLTEVNSGFWRLSNQETDGDWALESTSGQRISVRCEMCDGNDWLECPQCEGSGEYQITCDECTRFRPAVGKITCTDCDGDGFKIEDGAEVKCSECDGGGEIDCRGCDGHGEITEDCERCSGRGEIRCPECY